MSGVMILFAFMMSMVINLVQKKIHPEDKLFNGEELNESEAVNKVE
jgi:hypothetical protein